MTFKFRYLIPFLRELDDLKAKVSRLEDELNSLFRTLHLDTQFHQRVAAAIDVSQIEISYSDLCEFLDYSQFHDEISYRELGHEVCTTSFIECVAEEVDVDAIGDYLVGNPELTERVANYLSNKSLRFES